MIALSLLLVFGALASGQFSGVLALVVGVLAFGYVTRRLTTTVLAFVPAAILAALALRPVVERRIAGFDTAAGIPPSWVSRIENLQTYFLPEFSNGWNILLGVRPSARVAAPIESGREWIFIESGYLWLVWSGGIALVLAFIFFLWTTIRRVASVARARGDAVGVAAIASFTALVVVGRPPGVRPTSDASRRGRPLLLPAGALACRVHGHRRPCLRSGPSGVSVTSTPARAAHRDNGVD